MSPNNALNIVISHISQTLVHGLKPAILWQFYGFNVWTWLLREGSAMHLENDVALLKISISGSQSSTGHLFDEDLAAQSETVLCNKPVRNICSVHQH